MKAEMRKTTEIEKESMKYLNDLRESGVTNMYGATPYLEARMDLGKPEAIEILSLWMNNFNDESDYSQVKIES